jgi:dTDP-L-rhamnose 4-epimerase
MLVTPTADVVLPCLDEAGALPWVLERIPPGWRAVVVDNGSSDGSARIAAELGATVVHEPRRGFGAACHAGLLAAEAEFVCFCDCDASLDPGLLPGFVDRIAAGEADLVLGRRRPTARGAFPAHARAGNAALVRMLRRRTGLRLHDLGPLRAARREHLLGLGMRDRRSGYPLETVVLAADAGWRITEQDAPYHPRTGRSKVTGTWRGTWQAVHDMRAVLHAAVPGPAPHTAKAPPLADPSSAREPRPALPRPAAPAAPEGRPRPAVPPGRETTAPPPAPAAPAGAPQAGGGR